MYLPSTPSSYTHPARADARSASTPPELPLDAGFPLPAANEGGSGGSEQGSVGLLGLLDLLGSLGSLGLLGAEGADFALAGRLAAAALGVAASSAIARLAFFLPFLDDHAWQVAEGKQVGIQVGSQDLSQKELQKVYHIMC